MKSLPLSDNFKITASFTFVAVLLFYYFGYIDEGNAANYDSFFQYLSTDGLPKIYLDSGAHVFTFLFFISMCLSFRFFSKKDVVPLHINHKIILSIVTFPISMFLIIAAIVSILWLLLQLGILAV